MKKHLILILMAMIAVSASAQLKKYRLEVGDFNELTVADHINVIYRQSPDSAGFAVYICAPQVAKAITFSNSKEKLKIQVQSDEVLTAPLPTVVVYSSALDKATNLGDSLLAIDRLEASKQFKAKVIGNGSLHINNVYTTRLECAVEAGSGRVYADGRTQEAKYTIASVGAIEAGNVAANKVTCWMIGTGTIDCDAATSLSVYGAGTGKIFYKGQPKIKKRSVGVKVNPLEQ